MRLYAPVLYLPQKIKGFELLMQQTVAVFSVPAQITAAKQEGKFSEGLCDLFSSHQKKQVRASAS